MYNRLSIKVSLKKGVHIFVFKNIVCINKFISKTTIMNSLHTTILKLLLLLVVYIN